MKIFKYPFEITDKQTLKLPDGAMPRHVGLDPKGQPCLWAEVEETRELTDCTLWVLGTGHPVPPRLVSARVFGAQDFYVGSFVQDSFVWHVYVGHTKSTPV